MAESVLTFYMSVIYHEIFVCELVQTSDDTECSLK